MLQTVLGELTPALPQTPSWILGGLKEGGCGTSGEEGKGNEKGN